MKEQIRSEIRKVIKEIESSQQEELIRLRTFHYNVHHSLYNPIEDKSCEKVLNDIKRLLQDYPW